jgi:hypothetical protein
MCKKCCGSGSVWINIKFTGKIRIRIKLISWTRLRIRIITLQMTSQRVWHMSLFKHFFKVLSL